MKIVHLLFNAKLSIKFLVYYLTVFVLLASMCLFTYERINNDLTIQKCKQLSSETAGSLNANLNFLIDTANSQSEMLISSQTLQSTLRNGIKHYKSSLQWQMDNYLSEFTNFYDAISSIYIFDNSSHEYFVDNFLYKNISLDKIKAAPFYRQLIAKRGGYILNINAGELYTVSRRDKNFISLIRVINDINTQKPLGIMVLNISEDSIISSFRSVTSVNNTKIMLTDEHNHKIIHEDSLASENLTALFKNIGSKGLSQIKTLNGTQYIISCLKNQYGWRIATVTPINELARQSQTYNIFILFIVIMDIVMLITALLLTSFFITKPIKKLATSMKDVKNGNFNEVQMHTGTDEIGMLKDVYNLMISEIRKLFENIVSEQHAKRKAELEALQLQIKPHFLYNSFDAISSLALSGSNKEVYSLVNALGKFYRSFLNTGSEEITIGEELEIVRQYLTIQQIRFKDKFSVIWQIDERACAAKIPRLTLQPLVENAIKHGIRQKEGKGVLTISALYRDKTIELIVEDDGAGMDASERDKFLDGKLHGSGLKITRERLELYFSLPSVFELDSTKGKGTSAKITLPIDMEAKDNE